MQRQDPYKQSLPVPFFERIRRAFSHGPLNALRLIFRELHRRLRILRKNIFKKFASFWQRICFPVEERLLWLLSKTGYRVTVDPPVKVTVVLLSFKRMKNIPIIARRALLCGFVDPLVISNNNPDVDIAPYLASYEELNDARVVVTQQSQRRSASYRYDLAREYPNEYYIFIDDDLFPSPWQLKRMLKALIADPGSPRGYFGQVYDLQKDSFITVRPKRLSTTCQTRHVEVIMQVYVFTQAHLDRYFELLDAMGEINKDHLSEDLVISFSGSKAPVLEDVGHIWQCITHNHPDIAICKRPGFLAQRKALLDYLKQATRVVG